ncbi:MAG: hypothetical protein ABR508_03045, partial [Candidatus Baltobacteraceae bacterium]
IVIELKRDEIPEVVLNQLYKHTPLQTTFGVNMVALVENVPRTLPPGVKAVFEQSRWPVPALFSELCARGDLSHEERYRTFNMGIGYTLVIPIAQAQAALDAVPGARVVGWIETRTAQEPQAIVHPARA